MLAVNQGTVNQVQNVDNSDQRTLNVSSTMNNNNTFALPSSSRSQLVPFEGPPPVAQPRQRRRPVASTIDHVPMTRQRLRLGQQSQQLLLEGPKERDDRIKRGKNNRDDDENF